MRIGMAVAVRGGKGSRWKHMQNCETFGRRRAPNCQYVATSVDDYDLHETLPPKMGSSSAANCAKPEIYCFRQSFIANFHCLAMRPWEGSPGLSLRKCSGLDIRLSDHERVTFCRKLIKSNSGECYRRNACNRWQPSTFFHISGPQSLTIRPRFGVIFVATIHLNHRQVTSRSPDWWLIPTPIRISGPVPIRRTPTDKCQQSTPSR